VDCRAAFANLDAVKETLVLGVVRIAMATRAATRGRHTKRTAAFVKACVAFCFITTPSIDTPLLRVRLHLLTACAALANALLPQMDASFKAAVTIVTEMQGLAANEPPPLTTTQAEAAAKEEALVSILSSACSLLIAVPGHPDHGPFHMATGLLNIFHSCHWRRPASLPTLHLRMLSVFNAYAQPTLPYHAPGVDANDVLYAAEAGYHESLDAVASKLLETLLDDLAALKERTDGASQRVQARLPSGVPCPARAATGVRCARARAGVDRAAARRPDRRDHHTHAAARRPLLQAARARAALRRRRQGARAQRGRVRRAAGGGAAQEPRRAVGQGCAALRRDRPLIARDARAFG